MARVPQTLLLARTIKAQAGAVPACRERRRQTKIDGLHTTPLSPGGSVVHKCANPVCSAKLVYLRQGKLFEVEIQVTGSSPKCEHYWLCGQCAMNYTLCFDGERSTLAVTPLRATGDSKVTAISQASSKAIFGLKRVLIRVSWPPSTMGKAAGRPTLSGMEES